MSEENKSPTDNPDLDSEASADRDESSATAMDADRDLAGLRQQIEATALEARTNFDRYVRQVAEMENLKKRLTREKEDAIRFANEVFVRDLLPVIDNLERAISHAQGGGNSKPLVEGVEMVLKGLADVLNKHDVVQVSAIGEIFDPNKHEAMARVESTTQAPNTVIEEFHKGYLLKDRLLRPALVTIAKAPISNEKKNDDREVENGSSDD